MGFHFERAQSLRYSALDVTGTLAILCNSTVIEMCRDIIRISQAKNPISLFLRNRVICGHVMATSLVKLAYYSEYQKVTTIQGSKSIIGIFLFIFSQLHGEGSMSRMLVHGLRIMQGKVCLALLALQGRA
ncbi:MAG: hypothetical protein ACXAB7_23820 [Candidatus Kariarchaeaceae archaeon]